MRLTVHPAATGLAGTVRPPGDKSVTHRAILLGAVARGETRIHGFLDGQDTLATLAAVEHMGAGVQRERGDVTITGTRLVPPDGPLDMGNSGTGLRLLAGLLAAQSHFDGRWVELTGDRSLCSRPMARIIRPLEVMGARIESTDGRAPLRVQGRALVGTRHALPVASAQVKSAVLLAGLFARGRTRVIEPGPTRDHTERMLPAFGIDLDSNGEGIGIEGGQVPQGAGIEIPGDLSAAAFLIVAACLVPGSELVIDRVGLNPTRDGVLRILRAMGADLAVETLDLAGPEPVGRIRVRHARLEGIDIPPEWVPLAIDEFPVIMAAAAAARGRTRIRGAAELRVKESDRIAAMCANLRMLGVAVEEHPDGAVIRGGAVTGGTVDSGGDHRIAMSLAVLGLVAGEAVAIRDSRWIATSYPGFVDDMARAGARLEQSGG